ncbi:hypothetical protein CA85_34130 [Allorhodopirellula solitaria]|uniref:Uncharacterized protein n=1 Tax=Allorhodopirellula solitaria TaxID=2527987 RepID=A0A5C5XQY8_9BACT|nr:hypothetical protein CA85_34130 [Allorhodopirellula solitaria]
MPSIRLLVPDVSRPRLSFAREHQRFLHRSDRRSTERLPGMPCQLERKDAKSQRRKASPGASRLRVLAALRIFPPPSSRRATINAAILSDGASVLLSQNHASPRPIDSQFLKSRKPPLSARHGSGFLPSSCSCSASRCSCSLSTSSAYTPGDSETVPNFIAILVNIETIRLSFDFN